MFYTLQCHHQVRLAQQLLGQGLKVEPLNTRLLFASAVLCSSLGRHGDALELLDRGLSNPTGSGNYRVRTGTALALFVSFFRSEVVVSMRTS